jgi:PRTRC genetic system protein A
MNPRDAILQALTPVVPVPRFEALEPGDGATGHRFLVAEDGLWIEAELPWLCARAPLAITATALPFGALKPEVRLKCGPIPRTLLHEFAEWAQDASPREVAAIITWLPRTGAFSLRSVTHESGNSHVHWQRPRLAEGEHLVADLHSHGRYDARFSAQDDRDDAGEIKFSVVMGGCDKLVPQLAARLCLLGSYVPTLIDFMIDREAGTEPRAVHGEAAISSMVSATAATATTP